MAAKKLAERKKNKKAEEKKVAKLSQRTQLIKQRKEERVAARAEKKNSPGIEPIVNEVLVANSEALAHLERNMQILKDLEDEYIASQKKRANLQEELEAEGFKTLEEKMDHLKKIATERANEIHGNSEELSSED